MAYFYQPEAAEGFTVGVAFSCAGHFVEGTPSFDSGLGRVAGFGFPAASNSPFRAFDFFGVAFRFFVVGFVDVPIHPLSASACAPG